MEFLWGGREGGKINHLVHQNLTYLADGGLEMGGLQHKNLAFLATWTGGSSWNQTLQHKVMANIHGTHVFGWHRAEKKNASLQSPWLSISRNWLFSYFKVGNGTRIYFWHHCWLGDPKSPFPLLSKVVLLPNGSISDFWDVHCLS